MRISDWSSDVCSSDLAVQTAADERRYRDLVSAGAVSASAYDQAKAAALSAQAQLDAARAQARISGNEAGYAVLRADADGVVVEALVEIGRAHVELQSLMRISYAVFCLKKKKTRRVRQSLMTTHTMESS